MYKGEQEKQGRIKSRVEDISYHETLCFLISVLKNIMKQTYMRKSAQINNDIYLMSKRCHFLLNTLFWLRMGLYEREIIGAAGGISNESWSQQMSELFCQTYEEYTAAAKWVNVPDERGCGEYEALFGTRRKNSGKYP